MRKLMYTVHVSALLWKYLFAKSILLWLSKRKVKTQHSIFVSLFSYASSSTLYSGQWVSRWAEFRTSVAWSLRACYLKCNSPYFQVFHVLLRLKVIKLSPKVITVAQFRDISHTHILWMNSSLKVQTVSFTCVKENPFPFFSQWKVNTFEWHFSHTFEDKQIHII